MIENNRNRDYWLSQTWGELKLKPNQELPDEWSGGTGTVFKFLCNCERVVSVVFYNVTRLRTKSCGHCKDKSKNYWLAQKWGKLQIDPTQDLPDEWSSGLLKKFKFLCSCGRSVSISMYRVRDRINCGKCEWKPKDYWLTQTWGKLRLDPSQELPNSWGIGSHNKFKFICDCGKTPYIPMYRISNNKSCNKCTNKDKDYWLSQKWGELVLDPSQELPDEWSEGINKLFYFLYSCKKICKRKFRTIGSMSSCGKCGFKLRDYWLSQTWGRLKLESTHTTPNEWGTGYNKKLVFICSCNTYKKIAFSSVLSGLTNSCGCMLLGQNESSPETKMRKFITYLDPSTHPNSYKFQPEVSQHSYDIYIPSKKIAIEHHGLRWHSNHTKAGQKDYQKYLLAQSLGDRLIQIYEDEWKYKQEIVEEYLISIINPRKRIRVKPTYSIEEFNSTHNDFLLKYHIFESIINTNNLLTITAKHKNELVGVWVFKDNEWLRSCFHPNYKTWNPHSKALKLALPYIKGKVIAYSDNRLHTGKMYEKMGFKLEEEISPKYDYTKGLKRSPHKIDDKWSKLWNSGNKLWAYI